jgi:ribonuclease R
LFSEEYRLETKDYNEKSIVGKTINERIDLTDLPFCTIDPATAKDHDDAVYFDESNNTLYVAIADVSAYVEENSELDKDAYRRSLSMYMPNKVLPMLPPFLSEELCSLKPDVKRFAYTFKITFDDNNEVIEADLFESLIESKKKFSYGRIDRVLKGQYDLCDSQEREIFRSLEKLYKVTESLRKKRLEKGYDFRTSEYRLKLDNNGQLQKVNSEDSSPSHSLIEECMLQANIQAAKRLANNGIFRVHDEPNLQKINELITNINLLGLEITPKKTTHQTITYAQKRAKEVGLSSEIDELIIKAQQQAHYASKNGGHFGLGFEHYSHFTSPIRRYSDLILHRILKTNKVPGTIDVMCEHISNQERNITSCVWDLEDRKYARWAQNNIGKKVLAKIVDVEKAQVKLLEEATGATVVLTNYTGQKLFKKVTVKIIDSNIYSKNIYAEVIA